jgi:hypothetical protein
VQQVEVVLVDEGVILLVGNNQEDNLPQDMEVGQVAAQPSLEAATLV